MGEYTLDDYKYSIRDQIQSEDALMLNMLNVEHMLDAIENSIKECLSNNLRLMNDVLDEITEVVEKAELSPIEAGEISKIKSYQFMELPNLDLVKVSDLMQYLQNIEDELKMMITEPKLLDKALLRCNVVRKDTVISTAGQIMEDQKLSDCAPSVISFLESNIDTELTALYSVKLDLLEMLKDISTEVEDSVGEWLFERAEMISSQSVSWIDTIMTSDLMSEKKLAFIKNQYFLFPEEKLISLKDAFDFIDTVEAMIKAEVKNISMANMLIENIENKAMNISNYRVHEPRVLMKLAGVADCDEKTLSFIESVGTGKGMGVVNINLVDEMAERAIVIVRETIGKPNTSKKINRRIRAIAKNYQVKWIQANVLIGEEEFNYLSAFNL
jgi:hypothetical protein